MDAWNGVWGAAWGGSWGAGVAPAPPVPPPAPVVPVVVQPPGPPTFFVFAPPAAPAGKGVGAPGGLIDGRPFWEHDAATRKRREAEAVAAWLLLEDE